MEDLVVGMGHFEGQLEPCTDLKENFLKFLLTCQAIIGQHLLDSFPEPWEHDGSHHNLQIHSEPAWSSPWALGHVGNVNASHTQNAGALPPPSRAALPEDTKIFY